MRFLLESSKEREQMETTLLNPFISKYYGREPDPKELERYKVEFDRIYPFKECHSKRRQWMRKELYFTGLEHIKNPSLANRMKLDIISRMYARNYYFAKNVGELRIFLKKRLIDFVNEANFYKENNEESKLPDLRLRYKITKDLLNRALELTEWNPDFDEITKQEWEAIKNY